LAQYADASDEYFGIPLYWLLRSKPYVEVGEGIRLRFFGESRFTGMTKQEARLNTCEQEPVTTFFNNFDS
jgi:hypothetical protein